ncbi:hypothetical protein FB451DRAFT_1239074 [Mycena latifolia]|nr:hypothetical protein FB451DRAFT_1239074 [Mycena latifolia]
MPSTPAIQVSSPAAFDACPRPPSPGDSVKGLYVRSRPTSIDGSVMDAPFAQFSLNPTVVPLPADFPPAPKLNKIYPHSTKSMYFSASSAISIRTTRTVVIPVRAVRPESRVEAPVGAVPQRRSSWLKKMVPGMLRRRSRRAMQVEDTFAGGEEGDSVPLVRAGHTKSLSLGSRPRTKANGIENRPPPRTRHRRSRSFSGPIYRPEDEDDSELDDDMPEVREALRVNAGIHARGYRYERLDAAETRDLEEFIDNEVTW